MFEKSLLECGTMGTVLRWPSMWILLSLTKQKLIGRGATRRKGKVSRCALYAISRILIDHCIEWARTSSRNCLKSRSGGSRSSVSEPQATLQDLQRRLESSDPADVEGAPLAEALLLWQALEVATAPGAAPTVVRPAKL